MGEKGKEENDGKDEMKGKEGKVIKKEGKKK